MKPFKEWIIFPGKRLKLHNALNYHVYTSDITVDMFRAVFFPRNFNETYRYLGQVQASAPSITTECDAGIQALVIYIDYLAKPKWCPRWVLRFLHLFGNDNCQIGHRRNITLARLHSKLTKGYRLFSYKSRWTPYDVHIEVKGDANINWLANAVESKIYYDGRRDDLLESIAVIDEDRSLCVKDYTNDMLEAELKRLKKL